MKPPFRHSLRVAFADTDASGRVHFANVLRYVEEAEHALMAELGVPVWEGGGGWPRVRIECDYRSPLEFGDRVTVELAVDKLGTSSVIWRFRVCRGEQVCAEGMLVTVHLPAEGRPAPIPDSLRAALSVS